MDPELKVLYINMLKYKLTPKVQCINPFQWMSIRSNYCYNVRFGDKLIENLFLIKVEDQ
jgi:hypothetical protein